MLDETEEKLDSMKPVKRIPLLIKRTIDLLLSIPLLILFAPLFLILGIIFSPKR